MQVFEPTSSTCLPRRLVGASSWPPTCRCGLQDDVLAATEAGAHIELIDTRIKDWRSQDLRHHHDNLGGGLRVGRGPGAPAILTSKSMRS